MKRLPFVLLILALSAACGSDSAPTAPSIAQIAGVWRGSVTTASVSGGECLGPTFASQIGGTSQVSAAISQSGASISSTITSITSGSNLVYTGSVGASAVQLTFSTCSACNTIGARCPNSTALRDIKIQSSSINGTVVGNGITGTESELYNVFISGTSTSLGTLTINNSFSLTRQ